MRFINKMDRTERILKDLKSIREKLTVNAQPINIPIGAEDGSD